MADFQVYFFWPGLILSIVLSILLTLLLNLRAWKKRYNYSDSDFDSDFNSRFDSDFNSDFNSDFAPDSDFDSSVPSDSKNESNRFKISQTKAGGMIMIGPIPIVFGSGGVRFDKTAFKYALIFFIIVLICWFVFGRVFL
ncbi:MAG: DUF131 domain-containing protein [Methanimicrococcus sp.]|nr:DUF131 domain-containing protein [Methanimicrococcus sp.]